MADICRQVVIPELVDLYGPISKPTSAEFVTVGIFEVFPTQGLSSEPSDLFQDTQHHVDLFLGKGVRSWMQNDLLACVGRGPVLGRVLGTFGQDGQPR